MLYLPHLVRERNWEKRSECGERTKGGEGDGQRKSERGMGLDGRKGQVRAARMCTVYATGTRGQMTLQIYVRSAKNKN